MRLMNPPLDVIIVGGSAAGLSAALYLGRFRRRVVVFDTQQPANRFSHASHGFLTRDGVSPTELVAIGREQLAKYPTVTIQQREVVAIEPQSPHFRVTLADGETLTARKILLATGLKDALPAIEGIELFWGRSVFHCPYCDGYELHDQPVAILASGAAALHVAKLLRVLTEQVTICTNGEADFAPDEQAQLDRLGIRVIPTPVTRAEGRGAQIERIVFTDGNALPIAGAFVRLTSTHHSGFAAALGCAIDEQNFVQVNSMGATSIPGVYAAGDLTSRMRQVIFAASQGAAAGIGINMALLEEDFA